MYDRSARLSPHSPAVADASCAVSEVVTAFARPFRSLSPLCSLVTLHGNSTRCSIYFPCSALITFSECLSSRRRSPNFPELQLRFISLDFHLHQPKVGQQGRGGLLATFFFLLCTLLRPLQPAVARAGSAATFGGGNGRRYGSSFALLASGSCTQVRSLGVCRGLTRLG